MAIFNEAMVKQEEISREMEKQDVLVNKTLDLLLELEGRISSILYEEESKKESEDAPVIRSELGRRLMVRNDKLGAINERLSSLCRRVAL
jgi:hypothetical protein